MKRKRTSNDGRTATSIAAYDESQPTAEAMICRRLRTEIERTLPDATSKVWHGAPVWFVGNTPVVGYSVPARSGVSLLFWNGQAFGDPALKPMGKFKAAEIRFAVASEIKVAPLRRWLKKAGTELWDVRSVRRRKVQTATKSQSRASTREVAEPILLSGGNPHIAKGDGDAPVQAYIAAMPGWKRDVGRRLDALIGRIVPDVRKAVRWNLPFYGIEGQGWFLGIYCLTKYIKVAFYNGTLLRPLPPVESKQRDVRYIHIHEGEWGGSLDEALVTSWISQAAKIPGAECF